MKELAMFLVLILFGLTFFASGAVVLARVVKLLAMRNAMTILALVAAILLFGCSAVRVVEPPAGDPATMARFARDKEECNVIAKEEATPSNFPPSRSLTAEGSWDLPAWTGAAILASLLPGVGTILEGLLLGITEGPGVVKSTAGWQDRYDGAYSSCMRARSYLVEIQRAER